MRNSLIALIAFTVTMLHCTALTAQEEAGASLFLNIRYSANGCQVISGVSHVGFTLDKTLDNAWDAALQDFFKKSGIVVSTQ